MVQQRYVLAVNIFLTFGMTFALRMCFTLLLTQMVYVPNTNIINNNTIDINDELTCPIQYSRPQNETFSVHESSSDTRSDRYLWSQKLQGVIVSSFFWGNLVSTIPGGLLVQKYGGKIVLLASTFLSTIVMAFTPLAVFYGDAVGLIITRVLYGFFQGPLIPSVAYFAIAWFPIEERGRVSSVSFIGINTFGSLSIYVVGIVMHYVGRWDVVFYGLAAVTTVCGILFAILCYDDPQHHPFISPEERSFLKTKTAKYLEAERKNLPPTPWKAIITSTPVIALLISGAFFNWVVYALNLGFPKYLNDVLHIPVEKNSIYTSLPRMTNIFVSIFAGFMSDWLHTKCKMRLTTVRKTFCVLASILPATFVLGASYAGCDEMLVVSLMAIAISCQGFDAAGLTLNPYDLSPNYIGPLNGFVTTVFTVAALIAPYSIGVLTPHAFLSEWRVLYWLAFILYIANTVIFTVWGSAKIQPWNSSDRSSAIKLGSF